MDNLEEEDLFPALEPMMTRRTTKAKAMTDLIKRATKEGKKRVTGVGKKRHTGNKTLWSRRKCVIKAFLFLSFSHSKKALSS